MKPENAAWKLSYSGRKLRRPGFLQRDDSLFPYGTSGRSAANSSTFDSSLKKVVLVDCGVKTNIIRCLLKRDVEVIRVPWDYDYQRISKFDGLFISNGPGDPDTCDAAVQNIRKAMAESRNYLFSESAWVTSC